MSNVYSIGIGNRRPPPTQPEFIVETEVKWVFRMNDSTDMRFIPDPDRVPNRFVRWGMKVCLGCTWEQEKFRVSRMGVDPFDLDDLPF